MDGYHTLNTEIAYGDINQRWIVVFSEKGYKREIRTLETKILKEKEKIGKKLWHFSHKEFNCKKDGLNALKELEKRWKYHKLKDVKIEEKRKKKDGGKGRAKKNDDIILVYFRSDSRPNGQSIGLSNPKLRYMQQIALSTIIQINAIILRANAVVDHKMQMMIRKLICGSCSIHKCCFGS